MIVLDFKDVNLNIDSYESNPTFPFKMFNDLKENTDGCYVKNIHQVNNRNGDISEYDLASPIIFGNAFRYHTINGITEKRDRDDVRPVTEFENYKTFKFKSHSLKLIGYGWNSYIGQTEHYQIEVIIS